MADVQKLNELEEIVGTLKPYERQWCSDVNSDILMLPNGYLIGTYDAEKDMMLSQCFVPLSYSEAQEKPKFKNFLYQGDK